MITYVRSVDISQGKGKEATELALKVAKYINEHFSETNLQVMCNIGGNPTQLHWVETVESLAVWEVVRKRIEADAGFQAFLVEAEGLYVEGKFVDSIFETIS